MKLWQTVVTVLLPAFALAARGAEVQLERIDPPALNRHPAYTQVTTVQGDMKLVYVAGQVDRAVDYTPGSNECRHQDWRGQYIGVMDNIEKALAAAGATWSDVVSIRRFTVDMKSYLDMLMDGDDPPPAYWSPGAAPPSTLIEVVRLSEPCQLIEHEVMAVVGAK